MRKFYYKLVKFIGYTFLFEHTWGPDFKYETKYSHLTLYKYIDLYQHDGSMRLKRVWTIKIR